ncbi:MAG: GIY-YIG nuclease family protein [Candidatus Saccharimonadales bacterium]
MGQDKKQWYIYVLKLEKDKYYVGITSQTVEKRYNEHKTGIRAANWTKKYKPVEIVHSRLLGIITKQDAEAIENKAVREYINTYGINKVRGGDITDTIDLFIFRRNIIDKQYTLDILQAILFGALMTLFIVYSLNVLL